MGHLMSTVNPEAIRVIPPEQLPQMTQWVIYRARPGEGRRGRQDFPALVMAQNAVNGPSGLDLLVVYDANDVVYMNSIPTLSEVQDNACWLLAEGPDIEPRVVAMEEELAELRRQLFGEWNPPETMSVMDHLVDFETKLKSLKDEIKNAGKRSGPARGAGK